MKLLNRKFSLESTSGINCVLATEADEPGPFENLGWRGVELRIELLEYAWWRGWLGRE